MRKSVTAIKDPAVLFDRYEKWGFPQDKSCAVAKQKTIRVNTLKANDEQVISFLESQGFLLKPTKIKHAFDVSFVGEGKAPSLASTLPYLAGWMHIQELSSQLPPVCIDIHENMTVVDLAAAPGNKTTQISAIMKNTGAVIALDNVHERLEKLRANSDRLGATNIVAYQIDGTFADSIIKNADVVLCDAPCSGNFAQEDWSRSLDDIQSRVPIQRALLASSSRCCKKGGIVVYSTCSLEKEENEDVVEWALQNLPLTLDNCKLPYGSQGLTPSTKKCARIWPTQDDMGGFFVAVFRKK